MHICEYTYLIRQQPQKSTLWHQCGVAGFTCNQTTHYFLSQLPGCATSSITTVLQNQWTGCAGGWNPLINTAFDGFPNCGVNRLHFIHWDGHECWLWVQTAPTSTLCTYPQAYTCTHCPQHYKIRCMVVMPLHCKWKGVSIQMVKPAWLYHTVTVPSPTCPHPSWSPNVSTHCRESAHCSDLSRTPKGQQATTALELPAGPQPDLWIPKCIWVSHKWNEIRHSVINVMCLQPH